jgi:hypothetical protein
VGTHDFAAKLPPANRVLREQLNVDG